MHLEGLRNIDEGFDASISAVASPLVVAQDINLMTPAASAQPNVAVGLGFRGMAV
jgi:hypothetical protein